MNKNIFRTAVLSCAFSVAAAGVLFAYPKNIILMIGDGMGPEQVKAAGMYKNGTAGTLNFESFPASGTVTTYSADNSVTDSAAAATAIATGHKVNNGVISMAIPGDNSEYQTLLEYFKAHGKRTGLVTTSYMTDATPAGFGAHEPSRGNRREIASDYLTQTVPNVLMGGGDGMTSSAAAEAGYTVVSDRSQLLEIDPSTVAFLSGQFGSGALPFEFNGMDDLPHLSDMARIALSILEQDADGFFLMVEGGRIDHSGHDNSIERNIRETIEFSNTVQKVIDWAGKRNDTLVVVTADHETGGLKLISNNGQGKLPTVNWTSGGHSGANVPLYSWGAESEKFSGSINNTDFFQKLTSGPGKK